MMETASKLYLELSQVVDVRNQREVLAASILRMAQSQYKAWSAKGDSADSLMLESLASSIAKALEYLE